MLPKHISTLPLPSVISLSSRRLPLSHTIPSSTGGEGGGSEVGEVEREREGEKICRNREKEGEGGTDEEQEKMRARRTRRRGGREEKIKRCVQNRGRGKH
jgi:hypothetical protein